MLISEHSLTKVGRQDRWHGWGGAMRIALSPIASPLLKRSLATTTGGYSFSEPKLGYFPERHSRNSGGFSAGEKLTALGVYGSLAWESRSSADAKRDRPLPLPARPDGQSVIRRTYGDTVVVGGLGLVFYSRQVGG